VSAARLLRRAAQVGVLAALLGSCEETIPGELVGAYQITMRIDDNGCGMGALPLPDGHRYAAELRAEGERGYWRVPRAAPMDGRYDEDERSFRFSYATALELGNADAGTAGCRVLREETLTGEIDARREEDTLLGEHVISFRTDPSGRCADVRGPLGPFVALPCEARYAVEGTPRDPF